MSRWAKFRQLTWYERGFLLFSVFGLAVTGASLRVAGFERTTAIIRRASRRSPRRPRRSDARERARRQASLIAVAARVGFYRATCLRRSLLLWWLTRRRGLETELKIGVRRSGGPLEAHAWIELDGELLNDRREVVGDFSTFDAARLPEDVAWS